MSGTNPDLCKRGFLSVNSHSDETQPVNLEPWFGSPRADTVDASTAAARERGHVDLSFENVDTPALPLPIGIEPQGYHRPVPFQGAYTFETVDGSVSGLLSVAAGCDSAAGADGVTARLLLRVVEENDETGGAVVERTVDMRAVGEE